MIYCRLLLMSLLLCIFCSCLQAQKRIKRPKYPFNADLVIGINASQLDGDYQFGYHKRGFSGGLRGTAYLSPSISLGMELFYSRRGSQPGGRNRYQRVVDLSLTYAEAPLLLYITTSRQSDGLPKIQLQFGLSYARLLNYRITDYPILPQVSVLYNSDRSSFTELAENFNGNDLSILGGAILHIGPHVNLSLRHAVSTSLIYDRQQSPDNADRSIRSFFFSLHLAYRLLDTYSNKR